MHSGNNYFSPLDLILSSGHHIVEGMENSVAVFMERPNGDGWAHLVSDLNGYEGREELVSFGRKIGLTRRIHRKGSYAEHFDIRSSEIDLAAAAGVRVVTRRELGSILKEKKRSYV